MLWFGGFAAALAIEPWVHTGADICAYGGYQWRSGGCAWATIGTPPLLE